MTELFFRETTLRGLPVSFAIDLEPALKFGISYKVHPWGGITCGAEVQFHVACFVFAFTVYGRAQK